MASSRREPRSRLGAAVVVGGHRGPEPGSVAARLWPWSGRRGGKTGVSGSPWPRRGSTVCWVGVWGQSRAAQVRSETRPDSALGLSPRPPGLSPPGPQSPVHSPPEPGTLGPPPRPDPRALSTYHRDPRTRPILPWTPEFCPPPTQSPGPRSISPSPARLGPGPSPLDPRALSTSHLEVQAAGPLQRFVGPAPQIPYSLMERCSLLLRGPTGLVFSV